MKKIVTLALTVGVIGIVACGQAPTDREREGTTSEALGESSCATNCLDPAGDAANCTFFGMASPTNYGKSVAGVVFNGCYSQNTDKSEYDTPAGSTYPGDSSCPSQAILELTGPSGGGANFDVWPVVDQWPNDQASCETLHATGTIWVQDKANHWSKLDNKDYDYAGVWSYWPVMKAAHCGMGWNSYGMLRDSVDGIASYKTIRIAGSAYKIVHTTKGDVQFTLPARISASSYCIS